MNNIPTLKILVIHGPNMNLLGLRKTRDRLGVTLDKLNRHLRKAASKKRILLTIFQTNDESRAVHQLQINRNKIKGILLFPGPWQQSGHVIKDTLDILSIPYITVSLGEKVEILKGAMNLEGKDIYESAERALVELAEAIKEKD